MKIKRKLREDSNYLTLRDVKPGTTFEFFPDVANVWLRTELDVVRLSGASPAVMSSSWYYTNQDKPVRILHFTLVEEGA